MSDKADQWNQTDRDLEASDSAQDPTSDTVATPEGDNEFAPDEPLTSLPADAEQIPRGNAPDPYKGE